MNEVEKLRNKIENQRKYLILDIFLCNFSRPKSEKIEKFRQLSLVVFDIFNCEDPRAEKLVKIFEEEDIKAHTVLLKIIFYFFSAVYGNFFIGKSTLK